MLRADHPPEFHLDSHSTSLQSLRAIAAQSVAVGHAFTVMIHGRIEDGHFSLKPTNALLAAGEVLIQPNTAVILFYVLSGFVLGEALRRKRASSELRHLLGFAVRRLWRLLPVMWISVAFAAVVAVTFRHPPYVGATAWFNGQLTIPVGFESLLSNFLGLSHSINSVLWSIQIELAMIPLLPLAVWTSRACPLWADLVMTAALGAVSIVLWNQVPNVVVFAYCFYLGVFLPKLITSPIAAGVLGNGWLVLVSLVMLLPIDYMYDSNRLWLVYKFILDAVISAHVIAFVILRPDCRPARILDNRSLVWLGDVSYSFYVFGMAVLIVSASILLRLVPESWIGNDLVATAITIVAGLACVTISGVLAQISFTHIEMPCMAIGRHWSKRIELGGWPVSFPIGLPLGGSSEGVVNQKEETGSP